MGMTPSPPSPVTSHQSPQHEESLAPVPRPASPSPSRVLIAASHRRRVAAAAEFPCRTAVACSGVRRRRRLRC